MMQSKPPGWSIRLPDVGTWKNNKIYMLLGVCVAVWMRLSDIQYYIAHTFVLNKKIYDRNQKSKTNTNYYWPSSRIMLNRSSLFRFFYQSV